MTALLTARMRAAIAAGRPIVMLAEIDHPDGFIRVWSGIGALAWAGNTYDGLGRLGKVSPLGSTTDLALRDFALEMSGVPLYAVDQLSDDVRNRAATVWLAALDDNLNIVADPLQVAAGVMDYQTLNIDYEQGTATVSITVIDGIWTLQSAINVVWSTEEQIKLYPGDTGLDFLPQLVNKNVDWKDS
jgi:archaellum component FlaG (FlaF/FlaG flagellin family)